MITTRSVASYAKIAASFLPTLDRIVILRCSATGTNTLIDLPCSAIAADSNDKAARSPDCVQIGVICALRLLIFRLIQ
jgi:hypothetical protein